MPLQSRSKKDVERFVILRGRATAIIGISTRMSPSTSNEFREHICKRAEGGFPLELWSDDVIDRNWTFIFRQRDGRRVKANV